MNAHARNTATTRRCPECEGRGSFTVAHWNPEHDDERICPRQGCNRGWIATAPYDPITGLKWLRSFGRNFSFYQATREAVMRPVRLP